MGEVELELETPTRTNRGIPAHDPPRMRLNGKQAAPFYDGREFPPTLRQVQVGGSGWVRVPCQKKKKHENSAKEEDGKHNKKI